MIYNHHEQGLDTHSELGQTERQKKYGQEFLSAVWAG